jgi:hypothetical protein
VGCQKFCKLLNALRVIVFHPSSSTQHNNMAPTIERSQLARSRARGRSLTSFERGQIVQAYGDGYTLESIADQFQRAPSTISRTIHGVPQHNEGSERPRTGRPRTSTTRNQRRLENAVKRYPFWSYKMILRILPVRATLCALFPGRDHGRGTLANCRCEERTRESSGRGRT